ncbi:MAG: DUF4012 domain-containing protein [Candidatus Moraniibacteriota bacterium]
MQRSPRFWILFVIVSVLFLSAWYFYWETRNGNFAGLSGLSRMLPVSQEMKGDLSTVVKLADSVMNTDGEEKVFLILFQNNLELRPGGGFIGSFGVLKIRDGKVTDFQTHHSGVFDGRIPDTVVPPYPMTETVFVHSWKLRDSNFSPHWPTNAEKAVMFYEMGQGGEKFDGVIGITTNVLTSFLKVTGPVAVPGFPGEYNSENAIIDLEYQVERGYLEQGITLGERKAFLKPLGEAVMAKAKELSLSEKLKLFQVVLEDLHRKDIQIQFNDPALQEIVRRSGWSGEVDTEWKGDALMLVDANLNGLKSDYYIRRDLSYTVDLSTPKPTATATIHYVHTGKTRDFMTGDYQTYARVYVPEGAWLDSVEGGIRPPAFGMEAGRKFFGVIAQVKLGSENTVSFHYTLPETIDRMNYDLKIEKQPGVNDMPVHITIVQKDGTKKAYDTVLNRTFVLSEAE